MRKWLVLFLALAVAGCSDAPAPADPDDEGFLSTESEAGRGAISGVVVDASVRPIEGASVALVGQGRNATTDVEGRFLFDDLEPGTYFLDVKAARHLPIQQSAQVEPGQTAKVKVSLQSDGLPDPYKQTHFFSGIIHMHATVAWAQLEWMLDSELGITTPACECAFEFTSDQQPQGHTFEAVWDEATQDPVNGPHEYYWEYAVPDPFQEVYGYEVSPILRTWNEQPWETETGTYKVLLLGPAYWVAVEQEFEIFLTQWFNTDAPDDWAIADGDS